jgi:hypothetical protein
MAGPKNLGRGIKVTILGADEVIDKIEGLARRAMDLQPGLEVVADLLQAQTAENIRTRGGGLAERWRPLAEGTVKARRERWGYYGRNAPGAGVSMTTPLMWTGGMARSFQVGGEHHVRSITSQTMEWGSTHPIIAFHNSRAPRTKIPFRPMLGFRDDAQKRVLTVEPVRMWMSGMPQAQIRAEAFARSGLAFRRAG